MLDKSTIEKLLGRTLTSHEDSYKEQYINRTSATLENLLCWSPVMGGELEDAVYRSRNGYRTLWVDPFTEISTVKVDGVTVTDYTPAFNGKYTFPFFNSLEFDKVLTGQKVEVSATFGLEELPADLGELISEIFKMHSRVSANTLAGNVTEKRIEDFSVKYGTQTEYEALKGAHSAVIAKYSICGVGEVQHGEVDSGHIHSIFY